MESGVTGEFFKLQENKTSNLNPFLCSTGCGSAGASPIANGHSSDVGISLNSSSAGAATENPQLAQEMSSIEKPTERTPDLAEGWF